MVEKKTLDVVPFREEREEITWPPSYEFRDMVACPKLMEKGMNLVEATFCLERNEGTVCENFRGIRQVKHGRAIICAIPRPRPIVEIPIKRRHTKENDNG